MPQQLTPAGEQRGLCLLSLDAGGARGISQLKILVDLMYRQIFDAGDGELVKPCSVFDMIIGTGTGGFIAILLAIFRLTAEEAQKEFIALCDSILDNNGMTAATRTTALRNYIHSISDKYDIPADKRLLDLDNRTASCKLVVPISYTSHAGATTNLRNFEAREEPTLNLTIEDAIIATLAIPPMFEPISVQKGDSTLKYIGADLILGNPIRELIAEAYNTFGAEGRVACLLSLGCGHGGAVAVPDDSSLASWNSLLERLMMDNERIAGEIRVQMGHLGMYFRFSVSQGLERADKAEPLKAGSISAYTAMYMDDFTVSQNMDHCVTFLKTRNGAAALGQLRHSGGGAVAPASIPPVTRTFVKRTQPWEFMEKVIFAEDEEEEGESTMLAITGMGGCGKTQIVLKFMREHKTKFISQLYIDGSSEDRIRADIIRHVRSFGVEHSQKTFDDCIFFLERPSQTGRRLFFYDNVDDPSIDLSPLIPQTNSCAVIITSRNRSIGLLCPEGHLELDVMSMDEAVELLLYNKGRSVSASPQAVEDAKAVANELGCLPIALTQARNFMYETQCTAREYLARLSSSRAKVLAVPIKQQQNLRYISAFAAFEASYQKLTPSSQQFLRLLSCFHWANFPLELIVFAAKQDFFGYERTYIEHGDEYIPGQSLLKDIFFQNGTWDITELDKMLILLQNYSLTTLVPGTGTKLLQTHPLLHEWIHSQISDDKLPQYQSAAIILLALGARDDPIPASQYFAIHVAHLSPEWKSLKLNEAEAFALILSMAGQLDAARELRERVVKELVEDSDHDFSDITCAKSLLATTYRELAMLQEAEKLQLEVLRFLQESQGENHPDTMMMSGNLALTYQELGNFDKAEILQKDVLKRRKQLHGPSDPETIKASNNLAHTYYDLGRLEEAKALQLEVVKWRKDALGEYHRDTVNASATLAVILNDLKSHTEAEALQVEVLKIRQEYLGERHPLTIDASTNLAITYGSLQRLEEAERLQERVLQLRKETMGSRHPDTLMAMNNLADAYLKVGKLSEAETLQVEAVRLSKETFGERHPDTALAILTLAEIYESLGRNTEALDSIDAAIPIIRDTMGDTHPLLDTCKSLASRVRRIEDTSYSTGPSNATNVPSMSGVGSPPQDSLASTVMTRLWRLLSSP